MKLLYARRTKWPEKLLNEGLTPRNRAEVPLTQPTTCMTSLDPFMKTGPDAAFTAPTPPELP